MVSNQQIMSTPGSLVLYGQLGSPSMSLRQDVSLSDSAIVNSPTYTAAVQTGGGWLSVGSVQSGTTVAWGSSVSGALPGVLRVFVNYGNLQPGIHYGTVAISVAGASDAPMVLPITMNVRDYPTLIMRPSSLSFTYQTRFQHGNPQPQTISLFGDTTNFRVLVSMDTGAGWLSVSPSSSVTPANLTVSVAPSALSAGVYQGSITIVAPNTANSGIVAAVVLTVTDSPGPTVLPDSISLQAPYGSHQPVSRSLSVYTNGEPFAVSASAGDPWVSPQVVDQWAGANDGQTLNVLPKPALLEVWADPTGLAVGTYTSSVTIAGVPTGLTIPVTLRIVPNDLFIPQVADGGGWNTVITLVNTDSEPAPFTLKFWQQDGSPLRLPLEGNGTLSEYSDTIPVGGTLVIRTTGSNPALSQGWAEILAQRAIGGMAVFRERGGNGVSEAAVSAAQPQGKHFQLPFDNTNSFQTGLAVVNTSLSEADVTLNLRDENGAIISSDSIVLPAHGHDAMLLPGRYPQLANRRGVIEFNSTNADLAAVGLRFSPGGSFTSFESVISQPNYTGTMTRPVAQVADGGGWKTTFVLVNPGSQPVPFSIVFRDPLKGTPTALPLAGIGSRVEFDDVLPVGGVRILETQGTSNTLSQGWAEVVSSGPIGGTVVFGLSGNGGPDSEATVQILPGFGERFVFPFDNTIGFSTGLALLNRSQSQNYLATVTLRDESGQRLATDYLQLNASTDLTFVLSDRFPATQNVRGSIEISGPEMSALGLMFNPLGSFTSMNPIGK